MTDARAAAEVLVLAHQLHGAPAPRRGPSAPPPAPRAARAPARQTPPPGQATSERARPAEGVRLPEIPLTDLHLSRLAELERLVGRERFQGWAIEPSGVRRVDVAGTSGFYGETLHLALGAALRALGGER